MDDKTLTIQCQSKEDDSHKNRRRNENLMQTQSEPVNFTKIIKLIKQTPMNPTPLQYSWFSTNPIATAVCGYVIFMCIAVAISVLIVCFTSPIPPGTKCKFQLYPTVQYSNRDNSHPYSIAIGDFNSDGHADIVVAKFGFDNVSVFLGNGNSSLATQITHSTGTGSAPRMVAVGHFNNDTQLDVVVANFGINNIMVLCGNGHGHFSHQTTIDTSSSRPLYVAVGDFDNNGHSDIVFIGYGTHSVGILLGFSSGTFKAPLYLSTGYDSLPYSLALGDINSDAQLDIVVANYGTDNISLFLGYGNGTFGNQTTYTTGINSRPYSVALSDLNHNTHLDIAVVNSNTDEIKLFFDYENGFFNASTLYSTGENSNPIFIAIADFNNDNKSDITVSNNGTNSLLLYFGYGNRTFKEPVSYSTGPRSSPYSIGVADFNNDHQLDVAIANQQNNNIKIFNSYTSQVLPTRANFLTDTFDSASNISHISTDFESDLVSTTISNLNNDSQLAPARINRMKS